MCLSGVVKTGGYREESACLNVTSHFNISFYSFYFNVLACLDGWQHQRGLSLCSACLLRSVTTSPESDLGAASVWTRPSFDLPFTQKAPKGVFALFNTSTIVCCLPGKVWRRLSASSTQQLQMLLWVRRTKSQCVDLTATAERAQRGGRLKIKDENERFALSIFGRNRDECARTLLWHVNAQRRHTGDVLECICTHTYTDTDASSSMGVTSFS